jgi:hypothetical protein
LAARQSVGGAAVAMFQLAWNAWSLTEASRCAPAL